jgi:hypothetical protein
MDVGPDGNRLRVPGRPVQCPADPASQFFGEKLKQVLAGDPAWLVQVSAGGTVMVKDVVIAVDGDRGRGVFLEQGLLDEPTTDSR